MLVKGAALLPPTLFHLSLSQQGQFSFFFFIFIFSFFLSSLRLFMRHFQTYVPVLLQDSSPALNPIPPPGTGKSLA